MGDTDMQFCLRWNNFGTTMTSALQSLHEGGEFVDVTLAAEGSQLKAHKLVLSACSPYFRDILMNNPCQHPVIILREVSIRDVESLLTFIYEGQVNVSQSRFHSFMKLGDALKIRGLVDTQNIRLELDKDHHLLQGLGSSNVADGARASFSSELLTIPSCRYSSHNENNHQSRNSPSDRTQMDESSIMLHKNKRHRKSPSPTIERTSLTPSPSRRKRRGIDKEGEDASLLGECQSLVDVKLEPKDEDEDDEMDVTEHTSEENISLPFPVAHFVEHQLEVLRAANKVALTNKSGTVVGGGYLASAGAVPRRNSNHERSAFQPEFPQEPTGQQNLPYPCPFCDKAYTSWGFRRRHIKGYHTSTPELTCKWCYAVLPSHQEWEEHVTRSHTLSSGDARNGLLILEEAHMVLQIAAPTRIDSLMELIKNRKKEEGEERGTGPKGEAESKEAVVDDVEEGVGGSKD